MYLGEQLIQRANQYAKEEYMPLLTIFNPKEVKRFDQPRIGDYVETCESVRRV